MWKLLPFALLAAGASTPARAETLLATTSHPASVSSFGGVTAWSEYVPDDGNYRLALRQKGKVTYPVIAKRTGPFDVTVGPDEKSKPRGDVLALREGRRHRLRRVQVRHRQEEGDAASRRSRRRPGTRRGRRSGSNNYAFVRLNYGTGSNSVEDRCDKAFWRPTKRELHIKTVSLDARDLGRRDRAGVRRLDDRPDGDGLRHVRTRDDPHPVDQRRLADGGLQAHVLATSNSRATPYSSPVMDDKYIYATRIGTGHAPSFVRVRRDKGTVSEVEAQTVLAGSIALREGRDDLRRGAGRSDRRDMRAGHALPDRRREREPVQLVLAETCCRGWP